MSNLLRCLECGELLYEEDTVSHGCIKGFKHLDQDTDDPDTFDDQTGDVGTFMLDIHNDNSFNQETIF